MRRHNRVGINLLTLLLAIVIFSQFGGRVAAQSKTNEYCPVTTTEKADPNIYVDYKGQRIHFCCQKCKRDFLDNPDAYLGNLQLSGSDSALDTLTPASQDASINGPGSSVSRVGDADEVAADHQHESSPESDHDHATDHGERAGVLSFLGKFHPVVVHFPIALVITALIFVGSRLVLGREVFDQMAVIVMYWAAFFAVVAALLGLARGSGASFPSFLQEYFEWHRLVGLISTGLTVLTALAGYYWRRAGTPRSRRLFRSLLVLNVIAIGVTGHLGATLVYGPNYYG